MVSEVQNEFNMTALPSTSQDCFEDTFLPKMRKIDDYFSTDEESQDLIFHANDSLRRFFT